MTVRYATHFDVGDNNRPDGVNEDSVAITVFEQGHRSGYRGQTAGSGADDPRPATRSVAAFALADGAGGLDAGDAASYIASTVTCEELAPVAVRAARRRPGEFDVSVPDSESALSWGQLREAVAAAVEQAHAAIVADAPGEDAYTTIVAGIAAGGALHLGWVGDSRVYVVNEATSGIARLTKDHTVVERLRDSGLIDGVEARVHPRGNEVTRALGGADGDPDRATVDVDTRSVDLYAEDVVLAASDGLLDAQTDRAELYDAYVESDHDDDVAARVREQIVTEPDLKDLILGADSLEDATTRLVGLANDRGGRDNVSTLLFRDSCLAPTPADVDPGLRDVDVTPPIEERETLVVGTD